MEENKNTVTVSIDEYNALRDIYSRVQSVGLIIKKYQYILDANRMIDLIEHVLSGEVED